MPANECESTSLRFLIYPRCAPAYIYANERALSRSGKSISRIVAARAARFPLARARALINAVGIRLTRLRLSAFSRLRQVALRTFLSFFYFSLSVHTAEF